MTARKKSEADYLGLDVGQEEEAPAPKRRKAKSAAKPKRASGRKKITIYWREDLLEEARGAVLELGRVGAEPSNLSRLFDAALERELVRLRRIHNEGRPFEPYRSRLPGGRPQGS